MSKQIQWFNTGHHSAAVYAARLPSGDINLVVAGLKPEHPEWQRAEAQGFLVSRSGKYLVREGARIALAEVQAIFPRARIVQVEAERVFLRTRDDLTHQTASDLREVEPLGTNHLGQSVYESESGRYVRLDDGQVQREQGERPAAQYLRAPDAAALALCAEAFVAQMQAGVVMRPSDLRRFAAVVHHAGPGPVERAGMSPEDVRLRATQEAVEAAMQRALARAASVANEAAFKAAVHLAEHQPAFVARTGASVRHQQYSTPLPLSVAAQRLLGDTRGRRGLEPTIGNGSLVTLLPAGTAIDGVEIDAARVQWAQALRPEVQVVHADVLALPLPQHYDFSIANPPFGGLDRDESFDGLVVKRLDYLIVLKALAARVEAGRSVFIVGADRQNIFERSEGAIGGSSWTFLKWLSDHYEVEGALEINGRLYAKQGAQYPVRMLTVGRRRSADEQQARRRQPFLQVGEERINLRDEAARLPLAHTWDDVWAHVQTLAARLGIAEATQPGPRRQRVGNDYQAPYESASRRGEASTMVPRNLEGPLARAFARFHREYGVGVDEFVLQRLRLSEDEAATLAPEQIDAIALALRQMDRGRALVLGDMTGVGKGRTLAAVARAAALNGQPVVFLTKKPNLFTDFWRDLCDIRSEGLFKPIVLNDGVPVLDTDNQVVLPPTPKAVTRRLIANRTSLADSEYNLLMGTYSQFNLSAERSDRSAWLPRLAEGALLILDESHDAAGDSNQSANAAAAVATAQSVIYSSATYAKGARNMAVYTKAFPPSVAVASLADTLEAGGEPLQEILSAMLAEEGAFIRREHDLSGLDFEVIEDPNRERNEQYADRVAEVLRAMSLLSGDIEESFVAGVRKEISTEIAKLPPEARAGSRMKVNYITFGSRLYTLLRQFALALKVDCVANAAVAAIRGGEKPVIALEQTNESILKEALAVDAEHLDPDGSAGSQALMSLPALSFRDLLARTLKRLRAIVKVDYYGNVERLDAADVAEEQARERNPENPQAGERARRAFESAYGEVLDLIERLPPLPLSPIDAIAQQIEQAGQGVESAEAGGFRTVEISGRAFETRLVDDGATMLVRPRVDNRLQALHDFNSGAADAAVMTRAGSTGTSMHASERFADQRRRRLIELQIANDVNERVQFFGRINRRGQVVDPAITTVSSGLPLETRVLAMQNAKLRRLSANTQSNRRNSAEITEVPDILNPLGNAICKDFLINEPDIARQLGIELGDDDDGGGNEDGAFFVNKLFGLLALLPIAEQRRISEQVFAEFERQLAALDAKGMNPLKSREMDVRAKVVERTVVCGVERDAYASVFDEPVYATRLRWKEKRDPWRWDRVCATVKDELESLKKRGLCKVVAARHSWEREIVVLDELKQRCAERFREVQVRQLPTRFKTVPEALQDKAHNVIKATEARRQWLLDNVGALLPGRLIAFDSGDGDQVGVVVRYSAPAPDRLHNLGQHVVTVVVPGRSPVRLTAAELMTDKSFGARVALHGYGADEREHQRAFDSAPAGEVTVEQLVLTGNLFKGAEMAARHNWGRGAVFTDEAGVRHHGIFLFNRVNFNDLKSAPLEIPLAAQAVALIHAVRRTQGADLVCVSDSMSERSNIGRRDTSVQLEVNFAERQISISVPGSKAQGGYIFTDEPLAALVGEFAGTGATRMVARTRYTADRLTQVMQRLYELRVVIRAVGEQRALANAVVHGDAPEPAASKSRMKEAA